MERNLFLEPLAGSLLGATCLRFDAQAVFESANPVLPPAGRAKLAQTGADPIDRSPETIGTGRHRPSGVAF
jgi:hypothetical protein